MARAKIFEENRGLSRSKKENRGITLGIVVDNNDPQQMGRLRVCVPSWGESLVKEVGNFPWAMYVTPLGGSVDGGSRGIEHNEAALTTGQVGYGFFAVPKVGATVVVACLDDNPQSRIWLGCVYGQFFTHTLPHGRFSYQKTGNLQDEPSGPLSSSGEPIQPLFKNLTSAFTATTPSKVSGAPTNAPRKNFEFRTRGADHAAAGVIADIAGSQDCPLVEVPDDRGVEFKEPDGRTINSNQGYKQSRIEPDLRFPETTGLNYDPQVYSWTTPGFHSIVMDDAIQNCRVKLRTTCGHQIILDDTNERIYISTCEGKTWVEIDQKGNIDIYAERNVSVRALKDVNINTDQTFRVHAKAIHMFGNDEVRIGSPGNVHIQASASMFLTAASEFHGLSGSIMNLTSGSDMNLKAGGNIIETGANIHLNGPAAAAATEAKHPWFTSRRPEHEPWARTMMDKTADQDTASQHKPEHDYNNPDVGRKERGEALGRNPRWHR